MNSADEGQTWRPAPVATGADGTFLLRGLPAGSYALTAVGGAHFARGVVEVAAGGEAEIELVAVASALDGVVVDPQGATVPATPDEPLYVMVRQLDPAPGVRAEAMYVDVGADGRFHVAALGGRRYQVFVTSRTPGDELERVTLEAPASDVRLPWTELPLSKLTVELRDARTGAPLAGATVQVAWQAGGRILDTVDAAGRMEIDARVGEFEVVASARGYAPVQQAVTVGADGAHASVDLVPGRVVTGRLLDAQGQPAAGYRLAVMFEGGWPQSDTAVTTGADGTFRIDSAPLSGGVLYVMDATIAQVGVVPIDGDTLEIRLP
jgi:hypothetical protein